MMITSAGFEAHAAKLMDPETTPEARRLLAAEVRDSVEVVHGGEYPAFLRHFFPAFHAVLTTLTSPQHTDNVVHKTRSVVLEILNRLPHNDALKERAHQLLPLAMNVVRADNEDNACTALRIIFDLHKNYRPTLETEVQPFLDFVRQLYASFKQTVAKAFPTALAAPPSPGFIRPSTASFKAITECPIIVMFLFQLYPGYMNKNIPLLLPLMVSIIEVEIPRDRVGRAQRVHYQEFIAAQVKTVSFLSFLLKQFQDLMKPYEESIPRSVVQLLQACPGDAVSIRKELLVATRHIVATSFRAGFYGQIDLLLNEKVLLGTGRAAYDTLRPLAYSFLAELVHFVRLKLSIEQLSRIIYLFSSNVHDRTLTFHVQTTSVRLLLNLIDGMTKKDDAEFHTRQLLIRIMNTIVTKYEAIADQVPRLLETVAMLNARAEKISAGDPLSREPVVDPLKEINDCKALLKTLTLGLKTVVWSALNIRVQLPSPPTAVVVPGALGGASASPGSGATATAAASTAAAGAPSISGSNATQAGGALSSQPPGASAAALGSSAPDVRAEAAAADGGAASAVRGLPQQPPVIQQPPPPPRMGLMEEECEMLAGLLSSTMKCFRLYHHSLAMPPVGLRSESGRNGSLVSSICGSSSSTSQEEKEILDVFAQIFTVLDVRSFQDVFGLRMPELFQHIVENPAALAIPQHFLTNNIISKYFADILLNFLVGHLSELGSSTGASKQTIDATGVREKHGPVVGSTSANLTVSVLSGAGSGTSTSRKDLGNMRATGFLRLFQILFASVAMFPMNEPVLKPHLATIVRECLSCAARSEQPGNYLQLLRSLFKSLTSGKHELQFELLYRDFMPLVDPVFIGLLDLYEGPLRIAHKELIIELCLTVPARPSTIFPYLNKQIKPMIWALQGQRDNVHFGLRAIEFWVDTLQPSYLDRLMDEVEPELTHSLQRHARPPPGYAFGAIALRILGKLGSRSRRVAGDLATIEYQTTPDPALRFQLAWHSGVHLTLEADNMIRMASAALMDERAMNQRSADTVHKRHAWTLLRASLIPFLGIQVSDNTVTQKMWSHPGVISALDPAVDVKGAGAIAGGMRSGATRDDAEEPCPHRTRAMYRAETSILHDILVALITAAGLPDSIQALAASSDGKEPGTRNSFLPRIADNGSPRDFAFGLCQYFAMLHAKELGGCAKNLASVSAESLPDTAEVLPPDCLDPDMFLDAVINVMSRERREHAQAGLECLVAYLDALMDYSGNAHLTPTTAPVLDRAEGAMNGTQPNDVASDDKKNRHMDLAMADDGEAVVVKEDSAAMRAVLPATTPDVDMADVEGSVAGAAQDIASGSADIDQSALSASPTPVNIPTAVASLVERFCHCCYQRDWYSKWAGAAGLGAVIARVPADVFRVRVSASYEAHVVRALMFVIRDLNDDVRVETTTAARRSLKRLLELCHRDDSAMQSRVLAGRALRDITVCITVELTSDSNSAREAAKEALRTLAATVKCSVSDVVSLAKEQILRPLGQRALRQLSFAIQIGYIDAVTFCLELHKPLLAEEMFKAPLRELFVSSIVLVAEDATIEKLTEADDSIRHKLVESDLIQTSVVEQLVQLRRRMVDFLRVVTLRCPHVLREPANIDIFERTIATFFKSIQSRDGELIELSKQGLKQAIAQHPKPKDLLQKNLRPMLFILGDFKQLTIPYLNGLSRVLELLSHWFSLNLGDKLLEHLARWTEPNQLAAVKIWTPGTESLVGAAILDLFHMLPPMASKFLVQIVHMVLRLEAVLDVAGPGVAHLGLQGPGAATTSPYREPLLKFCNKHAPEAVQYFLDQIAEPQIRRLFLFLLGADKADPLRAEMASNPKRLIDATFSSQNNASTNGLFAFTGVVIVNTLARRDGTWLASNRVVVDALVSHWKSHERLARLKREVTLPLEQLREARIMAECFIRHCTDYPSDVDLLFHLLHVFSLRTLTDFSFVKDFFVEVVAKTSVHKRAIIDHFLSFFVDKTLPQERKVHALQFIVMPVLSEHLQWRREKALSVVAQASAFCAQEAWASRAAGIAAVRSKLATDSSADDAAPPGIPAIPASIPTPPSAYVSSVVPRHVPSPRPTHTTAPAVLPLSLSTPEPACASAGPVPTPIHKPLPVPGSASASSPSSAGILVPKSVGLTAAVSAPVLSLAAGAVNSVSTSGGPNLQRPITMSQQAGGGEQSFSGGASATPSAPQPGSSDDVLDDTILPRIMNDLLDQPDEVLKQYDEPLSAELLQLATLLVKYMPSELGRYRKELIKFGWNHLKREDSLAKQWAFVNVSRFFEAYQAPDKIILQVYVALLRACQPDSRQLVRQALDILAPALPHRLVHNVVDHKYAMWIRYTKKILLEEGHNTVHLVHIWQLVVRHPDLFYIARAQFVPIMVNSLARIGLSQNTAPDNRRLALDMADLIISWEEKRLQRASESRGTDDGSSHGPDGSSDPIAVGQKRARETGAGMTAHGTGTISRATTVAAVSKRTNIVSFAEEVPERPIKIQKSENGLAAVPVVSSAYVAPTPIVVTPLSLAAGAATGTTSIGPVLATTGAGQAPSQALIPDDFRPTAHMADMTANFLAQVAFRQMERREGRVITERCISLIGKLLKLWPDTPVKLSFLEKFLDQIAIEKTGTSAAGNSSSRAKGTGGLGGAGGESSKAASTPASKAESQRAEKLEAIALERAANRASALIVALEISLVLIDRQGKRFIALNTGAIRAMISPAMADHNVASASLLAQLMSKFLAICPPAGARAQSPAANVPASGPSRMEGVMPAAPRPTAPPHVPNNGQGGPPSLDRPNLSSVSQGSVSLTANVTAATRTSLGASGMPAETPGNPVASPVPPISLTTPARPSDVSLAPALPPVSNAPSASTVSGKHITTSALGGSQALVSGVSNKLSIPSIEEVHTGIGAIHTAVETQVERCLKADMTSMHCGLVVLHSLVENRPDDFARYQDLVVKALHRMAKESLNMFQHGAASGANASNGGGSSTKDKAGGAGAAFGNARGSAGSSTDGPGGTGSSIACRDSASGSGGNSSSLGGGRGGSTSSSDGQALILGLSLCGTHITSLEPPQKRAFFQALWVLIERCVQVKVLLEIVRIVDNWVQWKPPHPGQGIPAGSFLTKEPLAPKDMVTVLTRMVVFERFTGQGSEQLMAAYLNIVLSIFGGGDRGERRPELLHKLERAFMIGLKTPIPSIRAKFFALFDAAADRSPVERLRYTIAKQDWEPLSDSFWIRQALELLLAVIEPTGLIRSDRSTARLPSVRLNALKLEKSLAVAVTTKSTGAATSRSHGTLNQNSQCFFAIVQGLRSWDLIASLRELMHVDAELAHTTWSCIFPHVWNLVPAHEKPAMESALSSLFAKEYHVTQTGWPRNVIQALLDASSRCDPPPPLRPEILLHIGIRWNAWHIALPYLERRGDALRLVLANISPLEDKRMVAKTEAELESILDATAEMYRLLQERDMFAGSWKLRCKAPATTVALCMEQQARFADAQSQYSDLNLTHSSNIEAGNFASSSYDRILNARGGPVGKAEVCLWEERWVECARELCQWEVLTEFSRSCVQTELLHECLWRVPEWSALKELLLKHPVEEGPRLKLYQSYVQLQENKLELADNFIQQGMQRALEKYCSFPAGSSSYATAPVLVQFQQFVELQESSRILAELNALSRHGAVNTNVEQRIENVKLILNIWRERLPAPHESLTAWSDILTWRNHVHSIVVNVLEALKEAASQTVHASLAGTAAPSSGNKSVGSSGGGTVSSGQVQAAQAIVTALSQQQALIMGVNETAWSVHRFARACRKQGLPDVALNALQRLYPFGTMELTEYFVKTKETAKAYMACPPGLDNGYMHGLNELNRCNMDHFSAQQKSELFTMKGRFLEVLDRGDDVAEALSTALSTANDVSSAWLAWAQHSDAMHVKEAAKTSKDQTSANELIWREAAVNCYMQAISYGSRKGRSFLPRALRLLALDLAARLRLQLYSNNDGKINNDDATYGAVKASTSSGDAGASKNDGVLGVFMAFMDVVPGWAWLPWIAQLVPMLARSEVVVAQAILTRVAQQYPQAVFFPLRAFLEERKPLDRPSRFLVAEALRTRRPNTATLLPAAAASAQLSTAAKHLSNAHTIAQQAKQRRDLLLQAQKQAVLDAEAKLGQPEHAALAAHRDTLTEEVSKAQRAFDRALLMYHGAVSQKRNADTQVAVTKQHGSAIDSVAASAQSASDVGVNLAATPRVAKHLTGTPASGSSASIASGIVSGGPTSSHGALMAATATSAAAAMAATAARAPSEATAAISAAPGVGVLGTSSANRLATPAVDSDGVITRGSRATVGPSGATASTAIGTPATLSVSNSDTRSAGPAAAAGAFIAGVASSHALPQHVAATKATLAANMVGAGGGASANGDAPNERLAAGIQPQQTQAKARHTQLHAHAQAQASALAKQQLLNAPPSTPYEHADVVMAHIVKSHQGMYLEVERIALDLAQRMKPQQEEQLLGLMNALLHRCYQLSVQAGKEVAPSLRSALEEVSRMCFGTGQVHAGGSGGFKIQPSIADLRPAFEAELAPQTAIDFPTEIEPFIGRLRRWKNVFQRRVDAMPSSLRLESLSRYLIEAHNLDVEVFGQYLMAESTEPNPGTHVKIDRFSADVRVVRRHSGAARGVTIVGDNGKKYHFLLETSVSATSQPTEERAAQLCRLMNASMFARNAEASRRRIHIEVPILVPTGQHTRLVSDDPSFSSLAEGLEKYMESVGGSMDDPLMAFRTSAAEAYKRRHAQVPSQNTGGGRQESIAARVDAYLAVCDGHIPDTCLSDWIRMSLPSPSMHFAFRKKFAETLGTASLVSYALAIGARRPQNVLFSWTTGAVSNLHMRPLVSQRGIFECDEAVPFRLTRNLRQLLGPNGVHGPLFGSMAVTLRALRSDDELLGVFLNSIVRDELSAWVTSHPDTSGARGGGSASSSTPISDQNANQQHMLLAEFDGLEERLAESIKNIMGRLTPSAGGSAEVTGGVTASSESISQTPIGFELDDLSRCIYTLIDRAGRPEHLAQMDASWQAWF
jgi:phosphatidylinositol kinase/protein kinase (PI-3  family)